eukprot:Nk52_evm25s1524 gene=Nk52_evmTU25s1524
MSKKQSPASGPKLTEEETLMVESLLKQLQAKAVVRNDNSVALRRWYKSASEMYRMAGIYEQERDYKRAYILYFKFSVLILEELPKHNTYNMKQYAREKAEYNRKCRLCLDKISELKLKITIEHVKAHRLQLIAKMKAEQEEAAAHRRREEEERAAHDAQERELRERQSFVPVNSKYALYGQSSGYEDSTPRSSSASFYGRCEVPKSTAIAPAAPVVPDRGSKPTYNTNNTPTYDRSSKPALSSATADDLDLGMDALSLDSSDVKRKLVIPDTLVSTFLRLAEGKTRQNLECCAIMAGTLKRGTFYITHIIFPEQTATSDSCTTTEKGEDSLFDFQEKNDLITLGWIHTHPSQTCFMSSLDLHTHCNFQLMLNEAIAIVCAVKQNQIGVFSLTEPHGIELISKCPKRGFHPHPETPPIYTNSSHVVYQEGAPTKVMDLR